MKWSLLILLSFFLGALPAGEFASPTVSTTKQTLLVTVDNVKTAKGTIWVGIYESSEDFLDREKARLVAVKVNMEGRTLVELPDMILGKQYALGLFHDVNDNGEFDTNWLGLPAEPWAFSGRLRSKLRLPRFEEVSFRLGQDSFNPVLR
ncbi:MAG: DUF2141 domain-containing protein, partial [Bacteroidota bacterium]